MSERKPETCVNCPATGQGKEGSLLDNCPPGWVSLASHASPFTFLCETCGAEAVELTLRLQEIVKDDHFSFYWLLCRAREAVDT